MRPAAPAADLRRARVAVAVVFALNGIAFANWVPRIPEVKARLDLGEAALGAALLGTGLGALAGSVAAGPLVARHGSRAVARGGLVALCAALPLPGFAPSWAGLAAALVLVGAGDALMDVAMNAHGVAVERRYGRPILGGLHGLWSAGAAAGAVTGGAAVAAGVPVPVHLALVGLALALAGAAADRALLPAAADREAAAVPVAAGARAVLVPSRAVGLLGLVALCAAVVESAPGDWSAVYVTEAVGAPAAWAGAPYAAFATAMLGGRLLADRVSARVGAVRLARAGALLAAGGMALGLLADGPVAAVAGFGVVGLGVCTLFPAVFGAAGHLPGLPSGAAIATVSLVARVGFLVSPALIGAVAGATSLPLALGLVVAAAVAVAALAGALAPRPPPVP